MLVFVVIDDVGVYRRMVLRFDYCGLLIGVAGLSSLLMVVILWVNGAFGFSLFDCCLFR